VLSALRCVGLIGAWAWIQRAPTDASHDNDRYGDRKMTSQHSKLLIAASATLACSLSTAGPAFGWQNQGHSHGQQTGGERHPSGGRPSYPAGGHESSCSHKPPSTAPAGSQTSHEETSSKPTAPTRPSKPAAPTPPSKPTAPSKPSEPARPPHNEKPSTPKPPSEPKTPSAPPPSTPPTPLAPPAAAAPAAPPARTAAAPAGAVAKQGVKGAKAAHKKKSHKKHRKHSVKRFKTSARRTPRFTG
jgi:hypothetical protein